MNGRLARELVIGLVRNSRLHHRYRAMDFLEARTEALEEGLYIRVADLLNLDVEMVYYDTTSLHFDVDGAGIGVGGNDEVRGSRAAGSKTWRAPRTRESMGGNTSRTASGPVHTIHRRDSRMPRAVTKSRYGANAPSTSCGVSPKSCRS